MTVYDIPITDAKGNETTLEQYKNTVLLIVNTATQCGYTNQLEGLETLYKKYKDDGLMVLGFPCNQFGEQDPGTTEDSVSFCKLNYGVTFPMHQKVDVNGKNTAPLYEYLKKQKSGLLGRGIKWNFTKFLIDRNGNVIKRYGSNTTPEAIERTIAQELAQ